MVTDSVAREQVSLGCSQKVLIDGAVQTVNGELFCRSLLLYQNSD